ncbi:MAG: hypothetical protein CVV53_08510 [Spirochaetae bacterium HGW-Spirochaetae-9]|nr:MAG: hypothetical protein CVV53_08510 [Spirochaetae bacterium HGW-Spirochaetae-9]
MQGRPMGRQRIRLAAVWLSLGLCFIAGNVQAQDIVRTLPSDPLASERILLIADALSWIGTPYLYGGVSRTGVDCSGFLASLLASSMPKAGPYPRKTDEYANFGIETPLIEPGDILLFALEGDIYHVGLALSADTFIHAASEGTRTGVIISSLQEGSWAKRVAGVRRIQ